MRYLVALGLWSWACLGLASPLRIGVAPSADAFVRSLAPGENYGRAGALSVSGDKALNRLGRQMGTLDTFMRFAVADIAAGGPVSLFLTAADPSISFTFNSRNIRSDRPTPVLWLAAEAAPYVIPEPTALSLLGLGVALGAWRRVRK